MTKTKNNDEFSKTTQKLMVRDKKRSLWVDEINFWWRDKLIEKLHDYKNNIYIWYSQNDDIETSVSSLINFHIQYIYVFLVDEKAT